jgi:HPt (histidine-containing phosphotransfer) domain-containing protein
MSIQDVLAGLQKTYLASMPDKITLIESLFKNNDLEKLETEYHKLKGTGRTYGLPEFTQLGATLERICEIDPGSLVKAVPLSLGLIKRMRDARVQGAGLSLDNEPDFQTLVKIVEAKS